VVSGAALAVGGGWAGPEEAEPLEEEDTLTGAKKKSWGHEEEVAGVKGRHTELVRREKHGSRTRPITERACDRAAQLQYPC
jgi:hypothetical protein